MENQALLTFWGCRGSIPTPGPDTVVFGGNTSCVSIEYGRDLFIFDAGTGIRMLGQKLLAGPNLDTLRGHIFLSHNHWDHIQGLPFLDPLSIPKHTSRFTVNGKANCHSPMCLGLRCKRHSSPCRWRRGFRPMCGFRRSFPINLCPWGRTSP